MQLVELGEDDKEQFNNFVAASNNGSFLQSWEWGEWQKNLGREVFRFFLTDDNLLKTNNNRQNIIASIQLVKMPLPFGQYYLYAPYGPVLDLRFKIEDLRFLIQKIEENFLDAVFIRIEPKFSLPTSHYPLLTKTLNIQPGKTLIIDLTKTEEQLLAEMHSKTRYNIRLAEKHGIKIHSDLAITPGHGLYFQEVIDQIVETESRQRYKGHGANYYKKMVDFFALQFKGEIKVNIYKAINQNELLASGIMLDFGKTRTYLFGGSSENKKNLMAPYLLHFQAFKDAKNLGLKTYDFWGIETSSGKSPGFARFKMGFGGKVLEYGGVSDTPINNRVYWLYRLARKLRI